MIKKIALIHYAYPPNVGGVEILMKEQAHILTRLGYQVTIFVGDGEESNPKIELIKIPEFRSIFNINMALKNKIMKKEMVDNEFLQTAKNIQNILEDNLKNIETVIIHNMLTVYRNLPFIYAFREFVKKNPHKKIIVWVHDHMYIGNDKVKISDFGKTTLEKELLTTPLPQAEYVVISETFKKLLLQVMIIPKEKIHVIHNGVNLKKFLEIDDSIWQVVKKYQLLDAFPFIFSPVNILERKNIEYSLEIVNYLKKDFPSIRYLISGQPSKHRQTVNYLKNLEKLIEKLKIENEVIFLAKDFPQALKNSEIHDLYTLADLVFYFSKSENFGLPILEAALSKTPIFVSNLKVFHEVGQEYVNYIDYNAVNPQQATQIIKEYIDKNPLIKINYLSRKNYNLETIIKKKLVPLL